MEAHNTCPICFEIPEREIYQCSNGHIICSICVAGISNCPQCRISYGASKIRSRILENILDGQEFECAYNEKGCRKLCKRNEMSAHNKSCTFNPNLISLCEIIGYKNCRFSVIYSSRTEIIAHFKSKHDATYEQGENFKILHGGFKAVQNENIYRLWNPVLLSLGDSETSSLFLILGKVHLPRGFASWSCLHVWETNQQVQSYQASFTLQRELILSPSDHPKPISWTLNASTIKDVQHILEINPINIPVHIICNKFLSNEDAVILTVKISPCITHDLYPSLMLNWKETQTILQSTDKEISDLQHVTRKLDELNARSSQSSSATESAKIAPSAPPDIRYEIVQNLLRSSRETKKCGINQKL
ncbi:putative E3 ubiquitin-protein ligase SINA-like 6 [Orchesella cincta]|uniref:RING-type E3 ubiquitin transferase n=1 Tax=Orchesella cincta TaxID=48709 RepID=A0A1D2M492_ORCCI|nr:putative E3 ubiquitin-protein ligase SINA-like 6 [Orchesella cincta]